MSVSVHELVKAFPGADGREVRAVAGVSLTVGTGELVTLLGPSGCGKTTTLRMIAGFETPTSGTIRVGERDVTHLPAHLRNTPMVFQSYALFPHMKVRDNAAFGLGTRGVGAAAARERVAALAKTLGLEALLDRSPHELSGGQQQRVALLRALVTEPTVLLFDEPLSNLDAQLRQALRAEIRRLQRKVGFTAVYVTHDQEEAMAISDRVVVMEQGRIAQQGPPHALYARPASRFVASFLGEANFLQATVLGPDVVECALGRLAVTSGFPAGAKVTLVARPEALSLSRDEAGSARVLSAAYLGPVAAYEVALGELTLQVRQSNPGAGGVLPEGTRVRVGVEDLTLHVLPERDSGP